jgi:GAF domain-containing protein
MYKHRLFLETLSDFSANLLTSYDTDTMLEDLTTRLVEIFELAASGLALSQGDRLELATVVPEHIATLEHTQLESRTGPCIEAYRTGTVVAVPDLATEVDKWPEYCADAQRLGVRAVAGIPMRLDGTCIGAVNLYSAVPRTWTDDHLAAAVVLAHMATGYLVNASKLRQQEQLNEQLQGALESRAVIEQAKGIVASEHETTVNQAFNLIRTHARNHNVAVRSVADAIVQLGLKI